MNILKKKNWYVCIFHFDIFQFVCHLQVQNLSLPPEGIAIETIVDS